MEEQKSMEGNGCDCDCDCGCNCSCCKKEQQHTLKKDHAGDGMLWSMRVTDTVGSFFLGTLAILLLVFLVRSNRRNRELLLEVISLRRQP